MLRGSIRGPFTRFAGFPWVNPEARAWEARFTVPGTAAQKTALDTFVTALKAASIWSISDWGYVNFLWDAQACLINAITPGSFTLTYEGGMTAADWTANSGFTGDGAAKFLSTNWDFTNNGSKATQNSTGVTFWCNTDNAVNSSFLVGTAGSNVIRCNPRGAADVVAGRINDATDASIANTNASGLFTFNRSAADARQYYRNGTSLGSDAGVSTGTPGANDLTLLKGNTAFSARRIGLAWLTSSLDATAAAAFSTAVSNLRTALGAS